MINNPSQYQLDRAVENDDLIIVNKPKLLVRINDYIIRKLTNQEIFKIKYKNEMIDHRLITIYSKEEAYSNIEKNLMLTVYQRKDPRIHSKKPVRIMGSVNYFMIENGKEGIKVDFDIIKSLVNEIERKYKSLIENTSLIGYLEVKHSIVKEYRDKNYKYEFLNGFHLDIATCRSTKNSKFKVIESSFGIESDEFDTEKEAFDNLSELLETRIALALDNKLLHFSDLCKRERIGEDTSLEI